MGHHRIQSPEGLATVDRIRGLVSGLPEVDEQIDKFGHTSFRVRDKPFVILGEDAEHCWLDLKADRYTQEFLLKRDCFKKAPYIGHHGWTTVRSDQVPDWDEIHDLVVQAYLRVAPARLKKKVEGDPT